MFTLQQLLLNICPVECESHVVHMQALVMLMTPCCLQVFTTAQPTQSQAAPNAEQAHDSFDPTAQPIPRKIFGFAEACAEFWKPFNINRDSDKFYISKKYPHVRQSLVAIAFTGTCTPASMQH